jgi:hypothetical protein
MRCKIELFRKNYGPHDRRISPPDLFPRSCTIVSAYGKNLHVLKANVTNITAMTLQACYVCTLTELSVRRNIVKSYLEQRSQSENDHSVYQVCQNGHSPLTQDVIDTGFSF